MQASQLLFSRGYRLGPRLGKGSYAKVKLAERAADNVIMAAKIVNRRKAAKEFLKKFLPREISIALSLSHRNIIRVYEIVQTEDMVCIMMEFADRGDLLDYIKRRGTLKEEEAGLLFAQVCAGVDYLHGRNICHRDLKCENILLRKDMSVALSDLGFSRLLPSGDTLSCTYCGSAAYASPALLRGTPYKPLENDIWSLGCVLFIMVTGQMPFSDKNTQKMMYRQLKGKVNFPEHRHVSLACKNLIASTLQPNTDLRFDIKRVLSHHWLLPFVELVNKDKHRPAAPVQTKVDGHNNTVDLTQTFSAAVCQFIHTALVSSNIIDLHDNRDAGPPPVPAACCNMLDVTSVSSLDSEGHSSSVVSGTTSLYRMPGEACIIHSSRESHTDRVNVLSHTSNASDDHGAIVDLSTARYSSNTSQHPSTSIEPDVSAPFAHEFQFSTKVGAPKNSVERSRDKSPNQSFKMTIQKILQGPLNKNSYSKGHPTHQVSSILPGVLGNSPSGSQEPNYYPGNLNAPKPSAQKAQQLPANQTPAYRLPIRNLDASAALKYQATEVISERNKVYQEGLVKQMRRIFESKNVSTATKGWPMLDKKPD